MNNYEKIKRACQIANIKEFEVPELSDVLILVGAYWRTDFQVGINGTKLNMAFVKESSRIEPQATIVSWDLTKPVKDQSEKTLQFIADLL